MTPAAARAPPSAVVGRRTHRRRIADSLLLPAPSPPPGRARSVLLLCSQLNRPPPALAAIHESTARGVPPSRPNPPRSALRPRSSPDTSPSERRDIPSPPHTHRRVARTPAPRASWPCP